MSELSSFGMEPDGSKDSSEPQHHRTIDRVTHIMEIVATTPGLTFAEIARRVSAPKSSVHGFVKGMLATGWLHESNRRYHVGPAVYRLALTGGGRQLGHVTRQDLKQLQAEVGVTVLLAMRAGDRLMYVSHIGEDSISDFGVGATLSHSLLDSAGGKAILAALPENERNAFLQRHMQHEREDVAGFLSELDHIVATGVAVHAKTRLSLASVIRDTEGAAVAAVVVSGSPSDVEPRRGAITEALVSAVREWTSRG